MTVQAQDNVDSSWANRLEYCKAVRVFAAESKVAIKDATKDMLEGHDGGDGTCTAATPQIGGAAPVAAKAKARGKKAAGPTEAGDPNMALYRYSGTRQGSMDIKGGMYQSILTYFLDAWAQSPRCMPFCIPK